MKRLLVLIIIVGAVALVCVPIIAQNAPAATPAPKKVTRDFNVEMDEAKVTLGDSSVVTLTGNVKFTHKDTVLTSDFVTWDRKTEIAISPAKFRIVNPECDMNGDKGTAYFKKRLGLVEGNVTMLLKPNPEQQEPSTKSDESIRKKLREPTTITCNRMEYLYRDKIASATGSVVFTQEKRRASADKAVFDQKKELLTLTGSVHAVDEKGQTYTAPEVRMSLKKGDEWIWSKNGKAQFKVDMDEEDGGSKE